ncbi:hypothetical protein D9758_010108 [Tetrapyrgos nigripes]|uniref:RING-type domain-containing protein n=1 Tax=Tetrapyrgos nigripes TaxID=182062 RepID=A0A8H5CSS5_9AGAR|nr:hypothetical protein D9758_010108 [Tetrapyrgos nigripes]
MPLPSGSGGQGLAGGGDAGHGHGLELLFPELKGFEIAIDGNGDGDGDEFEDVVMEMIVCRKGDGKGQDKLPVVRYLPCISAFRPSELNGPAPPEWLAMFVHSDVPSVCIEDHNACCNICLEDFEDPPLALELQVDGVDCVDPMAEDDGTQASPRPLRQLICGHVFHEDCLPIFQNDDYDEAFECPACRAEVWTPLPDPEQFSFFPIEVDPRYFGRDSVFSDQRQTYDDYYDTLPSWGRIHQKLLE